MARPKSVDPFEVRALMAAGLTIAETARNLGCSRQTVYNAVREARFAEIKLTPPRELHAKFPRGPLTPTSTCDCDRRPIAKGSRFCCVVCFRSGFDYLPSWQNVKPLPKDPPTSRKKKKGLTRKERRELQQLVAGMRPRPKALET